MSHRPDPISRLAADWSKRSESDRRATVWAWTITVGLMGIFLWLTFDANMWPLLDALFPLEP